MENWKLTWTKLDVLNERAAKGIPNNLPGVYRLSYRHEDGNFYVFYVGQSTDIKVRLSQHLDLDTETNETIKFYIKSKECYFRYAQISEEYIRKAAERQMFKHYQPKGNNIVPEGRDDVRVNLT